MLVTHVSEEEILEIQNNYNDYLIGTLCFSEKTNPKNISGNTKFKYSLEINEKNILEVSEIFKHNAENDKISECLNYFADYFLVDIDDPEIEEEIKGLISGKMKVDQAKKILKTGTFNIFDIHYLAELKCMTEQIQGKIAYKLGYCSSRIKRPKKDSVYLIYCAGSQYLKKI